MVVSDCPKCGKIAFDSPFGAVGLMAGNRTRCAQCGELVPMLDGYHDSAGNFLSMRPGVRVPPRIIQQLQAAQIRMKTGEAIASEDVAALSEVSAVLGRFAQSYGDKRWAQALLLYFVTFMLARMILDPFEEDRQQLALLNLQVEQLAVATESLEEQRMIREALEDFRFEQKEARRQPQPPHAPSPNTTFPPESRSGNRHARRRARSLARK